MDHILVAEPISDEGLATLREAADVDFRPNIDQAILLESIANYDALIVRSGTKVTAEVLAAGTKLRVVGRAGTGVDNIDVDAANERGIIVVNAPASNSVAVAELTIGLILALVRQVPQAHGSLQSGKWERNKFMGFEVRGKTLGLVGLGRIGRRVAQICGAGLGMRVIGSDPFVSAEQAAALGVTLRSQDEVIAEADFLSLHAPALPETYRMINRDSIARMKDGAYVINVARGPLVDEEAILEAVNHGKLAGVALDVFDPEPALVDSPLRNHPNILVTPHTASLTAEGRARIEQMAVDRLIEFFSGQRPKDICNPEVWEKRR